ncbi:MAG TPA: hypothetical protein VIX60_04310 [Candidatus Cybelea sp.]
MDAVRQIAQAVLYEGYLLWPYRRSALKNQHRFTIGGLYPARYAQSFGDRSEARVECLIEGTQPELDLEVRFLHMIRRQVCVDGSAVDDVTLDGRRYLTWDETVERSAGEADRLTWEAGSERERVSTNLELLRSWERIDGLVECHVARLDDALQRISIRVANESLATDSSRDAALRCTMLACHVVLHVRDGTFVSTVDPPATLAKAAQACRSEGLWPVLVGTPPARDTILASPIILEEYPQIAAETPCDFFDGAEIGELLAQSILALSDEEKQEMRATDPRARQILERVESMTPIELARLHGGLRPRESVT